METIAECQVSGPHWEGPLAAKLGMEDATAASAEASWPYMASSRQPLPDVSWAVG